MIHWALTFALLRTLASVRMTDTWQCGANCPALWEPVIWRLGMPRAPRKECGSDLVSVSLKWGPDQREVGRVCPSPALWISASLVQTAAQANSVHPIFILFPKKPQVASYITERMDISWRISRSHPPNWAQGLEPTLLSYFQTLWVGMD